MVKKTHNFKKNEIEKKKKKRLTQVTAERLSLMFKVISFDIF